jgi:hypothetical protein
VATVEWLLATKILSAKNIKRQNITLWPTFKNASSCCSPEALGIAHIRSPTIGATDRHCGTPRTVAHACAQYSNQPLTAEENRLWLSLSTVKVLSLVIARKRIIDCHSCCGLHFSTFRWFAFGLLDTYVGPSSATRPAHTACTHQYTSETTHTVDLQIPHSRGTLADRG